MPYIFIISCIRAALLGKRYHGGYIFVFQVLNFDGQVFLVEDFAEEIGQGICSVGQILTGLVFHIVGQICIDALEGYMLVVTLAWVMKAESMLCFRMTASMPWLRNMLMYWLC